MSPDTKALVDAIDSLHQSSSIFKSYIFPFIPVVTTALLGYFIARFSFKWQQNKLSEAIRLKQTNAFLIQIRNALQALLTEKKKYYYFMRNHSNVTIRIFLIKEITTQFPDVKNVEDMYFLDPNKIISGWADIDNICKMVWQYNKLVYLSAVRNELLGEIEKLVSYDSNGALVFDFTSLEGPNRLVFEKAIKITETFIKLLDDIVIDMHNFLNDIENITNGFFPKIAGKVVTFEFIGEDDVSQHIERICEPDFDIWANAINGDSSSIRRAYNENNLY
ncbi:TPA: hypothetical protein ACG1DO_004122 [Kluyvera ascorbata]